mgnify:CR=1 FL=1
MKTNITLALVALMSTGCFSAHAHTSIADIYVTPALVAPQPSVQISINPIPLIQFHYVFSNNVWIRRAGPPPRGARYHAHPRHRHSVIVHRSTQVRRTATVTHGQPRTQNRGHSSHPRNKSGRSTR